MSKLTDDLRACDPIASPNVAGILMDTAANLIDQLETAAVQVVALPPGPFILRMPEETTAEVVEFLLGWLERGGRKDAAVFVGPQLFIRDKEAT